MIKRPLVTVYVLSRPIITKQINSAEEGIFFKVLRTDKEKIKETKIREKKAVKGEGKG